MGMTITERILANRAEVEAVTPGQVIIVRPDVILGTDATAPLALEAFKRMGATKVVNPDKIVIVVDHIAPARDVRSAEAVRALRDFAEAQGIRRFYDAGRAGICHCLLPEMGLVVPGDVVMGASSHTCTYGALGAFAAGVGSVDLAAAWALGETWFRVPETLLVEFTGRLQPWVGGKDMALMLLGNIGPAGAQYKAVEFTGEAVWKLPMSHRFTLCNMASQAGAKNAIIAPDDVTSAWIRQRAQRPIRLMRSDPEARPAETKRYDVTTLAPQVACPPLPTNVRSIGEVGTVRIDQAVIGSCTNGQIEDLRDAATLLKGGKVNQRVRLIIVPGTPAIYRQAVEEGLIATFLDAEATVLPPGCGPCAGGHLGLLAKGEVAVATTSRNFAGQMGDPGCAVYLASPAVAAASALTGVLSDPRQVKR